MPYLVEILEKETFGDKYPIKFEKFEDMLFRLKISLFSSKIGKLAADMETIHLPFTIPGVFIINAIPHGESDLILFPPGLVACTKSTI